MENEAILYDDGYDTAVQEADPFPSLRHARLTTVLLIEDNVDLSDALHARLSSSDFHVTTAYDGMTGFRLVGYEQPDIVILDLALPRLDGYKVLHRIRTEPGMLHTPIIILTGSADPDVEAKVANWDVSCVLRKPVSTRKIVSAIRRVLSDEH